MDADSRQIRHLIPDGVLALAFIAVELQLGNVASCITGTDIANIAEATRHRHIGIVHLLLCPFDWNDVEGHGIEEVGAVAPLEDTELHAPFLACAGTPAYPRDDVCRAQVQTDPGARAVHRSIKGVVVAVEGMSGRIDRCARLVGVIVDVGRTDRRAAELRLLWSVLRSAA